MVTRAQTKIGSTRLSKNWKRKRLRSPSSFVEGSFRTIDLGKGKKGIIGKLKSTGEMALQNVMTPRKKKQS